MSQKSEGTITFKYYNDEEWEVTDDVKFEAV